LHAPQQIATSEADAIVFCGVDEALAQTLLWESAALRVALRVGDRVDERRTALGRAELWDGVVAHERARQTSAADDNSDDNIDYVALTAWTSAFTGLPMARARLDQLADVSLQRVASLLHADSRVLELGSASGLMTTHVAPRVASLIASDVSAGMCDALRAQCARRAWQHVDVRHGDALCIAEQCAERNERFELIVLFSVVQYLPSLGYLRELLRVLTPLLAPRGAILLGDVMLSESRRALDAAVVARADSPSPPPALRVRLRWDDELFVPRAFLLDAASSHGDVLSVPEFYARDIAASDAGEPCDEFDLRTDVVLRRRCANGRAPRAGSSRKPVVNVALSDDNSDDIDAANDDQHDDDNDDGVQSSEFALGTFVGGGSDVGSLRWCSDAAIQMRVAQLDAAYALSSAIDSVVWTGAASAGDADIVAGLLAPLALNVDVMAVPLTSGDDVCSFVGEQCAHVLGGTTLLRVDADGLPRLCRRSSDSLRWLLAAAGHRRHIALTTFVGDAHVATLLNQCAQLAPTLCVTSEFNVAPDSLDCPLLVRSCCANRYTLL
jgi:2-polyprenyl-3-methyl-5-hydroxy-6-metoxy-1,4-benzoquinol methylase